MLTLMHWLAAAVILVEAINKAERTDPFRGGLPPRNRAAEWLKAAAWVLLALGACGALVGPLIGSPSPSLGEVCITAGFAVLIIKTRVKEG